MRSWPQQPTNWPQQTRVLFSCYNTRLMPWWQPHFRRQWHLSKVVTKIFLLLGKVSPLETRKIFCSNPMDVVFCLQGPKAPSNIVRSINCFQRWQIWHDSSSSVTTSNWLEHPIASVPISVLASSSSEASSLSSSHSSNSIPSTDMGNPVTGTHPQIHVTGESNTPTTPSATSLPPFSLPPYLQSPKESSNNANFQGMFLLFLEKMRE